MKKQPKIQHLIAVVLLLVGLPVIAQQFTDSSLYKSPEKPTMLKELAELNNQKTQAETVYLLDSIHSSSENENGEKFIYGKAYRSFNTNLQLVREDFFNYNPDTADYVLFSYKEWNYNEEGLLVQQTNTNISEPGIDYNQHNYSYNEEGALITYQYGLWSEQASSFLVILERRYAYDEELNLTHYEFWQYISDLGELRMTWFEDYEYDLLNRVVKKEEVRLGSGGFRWTTIFEFGENSRLEREYCTGRAETGGTLCNTDTIYLSYEGQTDQLVNKDKFDYKYEEEQWTLKETTRFTYQEGLLDSIVVVPTNGSMMDVWTYSYNDQNLQITEVKEKGHTFEELCFKEKHENAYDDRGNMLEDAAYLFKHIALPCEGYWYGNFYAYTYAYDEHNNMSIKVDKLWDEALEDWTERTTHEYFYSPHENSIAEQESREVNVSPNPCSNTITFSWEETVRSNITLQVFTINGVNVHEQQLSPTTPTSLNWNCSHLGEGLYIFKIQSEEGVFVGKFVKQ